MLGIDLTPDEYIKRKSEIQYKFFPSCEPMPGVVDLVAYLKQRGVPMAVGTSSGRKIMQMKTTRHEKLFSLFDAIVCGDDPEVKHGKPRPDIFLAAGHKINVTDPSRCLVFEDARNGVQAALAAEMKVVWIPDPRTEDTGTSGATLVINSMGEFDPAQFGL